MSNADPAFDLSAYPKDAPVAPAVTVTAAPIVVVPPAAPAVSISAKPIGIDPPAAPANDVATDPARALSPSEQAAAEVLIDNPSANRAAVQRRFGLSWYRLDALTKRLRREGKMPDRRCIPRANEPGPGEVTLEGAAQILTRSVHTLDKVYIPNERLTPVRVGDRGTRFYAIADCERLRDEIAADEIERKRLTQERRAKKEAEKRGRHERVKAEKRARPAFGGRLTPSGGFIYDEEPSSEILDPRDDGLHLDRSIAVKIRAVVDPVERSKRQWKAGLFSPRPTPRSPERDRSRAALLALLDPAKIVRAPLPTDRYAETVERNEAFRVEREESEAPSERRRRRERHEAVLAERALDLSADEVIGKDRGPLSPEDLRLMAKAKARTRLKEIAKAHARALLRLAGREHELDHQWRDVGETEDDSADNEAGNDAPNDTGDTIAVASDSSDAL